MAKKSIAYIGIESSDPRVENINFSDKHSILDFETVVVDPSQLLRTFSSVGDLSNGNPLYRGAVAEEILDSIRRRNAELKEFVGLGRNLVVLAGRAKTFSLERGGSYVGFSSEQVLPDLLRLKVDERHGRNIQLAANNLFNSNFEKLVDCLSYKGSLSNFSGEPLLFIKDTNLPVGGLISLPKSKVIVFPFLDMAVPRGQWVESDRRLLDSILGFFETLRAKPVEISRPEWVDDLHFPTEVPLIERRILLIKSKEALEEELGTLGQEIEELQDYKLLLFGTGEALHQKVIQVLNELGIESKAGANRVRGDIVMSFSGVRGVAEVKGKKGTASEGDARQLDAWSNDFYFENEFSPKGILIINAFNETPYGERIDSAFPDAVIKYSTRREHCLITSAQLLNIWLCRQQDVLRADAAVARIFQTNGVFVGFEKIGVFE